MRILLNHQLVKINFLKMSENIEYEEEFEVVPDFAPNTPTTQCTQDSNASTSLGGACSEEPIQKRKRGTILLKIS